MHGVLNSIFIFVLILGAVSAATDCAKPSADVNPIKIRQCCNGPPLDSILKESFAEPCKAVLSKIPAKASGPPSSTPSAATPTPGSTNAAPSAAPSASPSAATAGAPVVPGTPPANIPKGVPGVPGPLRCSAECMIKQTELFNNGEFATAKVDGFLNNIVKDDDFTDVLRKAMPECAKKAREQMKSMQNVSGCSPHSALFLRCLNQESANACPESRWLQTTTCNKVRTFIKTCGVPSTA